MTRLRRRLRRLRFALVALVAGAIILVAVVVGLSRLALPWLAHNPERIADWLSQRLGRSVTVGSVSELWTRAGPRLVLDDLAIGRGAAGEAPLNLARAEIALNLYAPFQRNRAWNEFRLIGLDLALERDDSGVWQVRGIDTSGAGRASMGALGAVVLVDLKLAVRDASRGLDLNFAVPELRVVNLGDTTRVLGRVGFAGSTSPPFSLVADVDLPAKSGHGWLGGRDLDLAEVAAGHAVAGLSVPRGRGDIELWGTWSAGRIDDVRTRIDLRDTTLAATTEVGADAEVAVTPRAAFERLALVARWQRTLEGWTFDLADGAITRRDIPREGARVHLEHRAAEAPRYRATAAAIDIESLGSLAMLVARLPPGLRSWLYLANPRGTLTAAELDWTTADDFRVDLRLDAFAAHDAGAIPGIEPLQARLRGDADALLLELPQQATRLDYPHAFRSPFEWTRFGGDIVAWRDAGHWRVETAQVAIEAPDYAIDLRGAIEFEGDGSKPLLDLHALVVRADVIAAKRFWPMRSMSAKTIDWLDRALAGGQVVGRAVVRGDLDDWPFDESRGRFEARADLEALDLDFLPDWPRGEQLDVVARFINNGMHATVSRGRSLGVEIDAVEATIAQFGESILDLQIEGHGSGSALLDYLRASPVGKANADSLGGLRIGGQGQVKLALHVPLKSDEPLTLDGDVELANADLVESTWGVAFGKANGNVHFTRSSVATSDLAVQYEGRPARLGIAIGSAAADPDNAFEASLHATLPVASVFARASDLAPAFARFPGEAQWQVGLAIGSAEGSAPARRQLRIGSDLVGVAIDLPAPLRKDAATAMPFSLALGIPPLGSPFEAALGDIVRVHGRLPTPTDPLAARLDFGAAATGGIPARGVVVDGHVAALDLGGWIGLLGGGADGVGASLQEFALDADDLQLGGRHFPGTRVEVTPAGDATTIRFSGASLEGDVHLPAKDLARAGITAQLKRLHWPEPAAGEQDAPNALSGIAPASIPPLHLWVGELRMGTANLGEARFESWPTADGMHIDRLETESPDIGMRASGSWNGSATDNRSQLDIDMTSQNLGRMLDALGFAGVIDGGQTLAHITASWPGAPGAFALANVTGTLEIGVDKGRILDVDPGAGGRLFGLLSLREIPRRLSLDFSDFFKSGMTFNAINGSFALRDGDAFTEDLKISTPAAEIEISGRTGLRSKDYDQQMVVTPRAGVTLPVVGALAGGPVGAAAGLVMQGLLGKQINQVARSRYHVEGSWEKPVIKLLGREKTTAAAKPAAPGRPSAQDEASAAPAETRPTDPRQVPEPQPDPVPEPVPR